MKVAVASPKRLPLESVYRLWAWVLLAWSLYRYLFVQPEWVDEFIFKPLIFALPAIWYVRRLERRPLASLGLTRKNLFPAVLIGLAIGLLFVLEGLASNFLKYGKLQFNPAVSAIQSGLVLLIALSVATAFCEELLNRGFLFNRIYGSTKNLKYAAVVSTVLFVLLHVPILVTTLKLQGMTLVIYFATDFIIGLVNCVLLFNTGNLAAPVLVHFFWNLTAALLL